MKVKNKTTLKIYFTIIIISSFFIFSFAYISYLSEVNKKIYELKKEKEIILDLIDNDLEIHFNDFVRDINYLSTIKTFGKFLTNKATYQSSSSILTRYLAIKNKYIAVVIRDVNDNVVINKSINTYSVLDQTYSSYLQSHKDTIPKFSVETTLHETLLPNHDSIFSLTVPVYDSNHIAVGTLTLFWSKNFIKQKIAKYINLDLLSNYNFYWFNYNSLYNQNSDISKDFEKIMGDQEKGTVIVKNKFFTFDTIDLKKIEPTVNFSDTTSTLWKIVIKVPKEELVRLRNGIFIRSIYLAIFILLLISAFVWIILQEIAKRKFYEIQLEEKNKVLVENAINKDKFLSILAHDLKSPFTGITGIFNLLTRKYDIYDDSKKKELIFSLNDSIQGINTLLINLLKWTQIQHGSLQAAPRKIQVSQLVTTIFKQVKVNLEAKNIAFYNNTSDKHLIFADIDMVEVIIRNIISNAIKFTPSFGSIEVTTSNIDGYIAISVKDTGNGMSLEIQSKLFNSHSRITTLGTDNEKGTGLGLIITRNFIDLNHGILEIDSTEGVGTIIIVKLPIYKEKDKNEI